MSYRNNNNNKRNNNRGHNDNQNKPSKVLHVRNLPAYATEAELAKLCSPFGKVLKTFFLQGKQQAFVEMGTTEEASRLIEYYNNNASLIRNKRVYFQFSTRQEISSGQTSSSIGYTASQKDQGIAPPSSILIVSVYNTLVPVTLENLHQIFKACGRVLKIITFVKNNIFKGLVQMGSVEDATASIAQLDGRDIFQGCCTLRIGYSTLGNLSIKSNGPNSWDFTIAENVELSQNHYRQQMAQYHQYAANPPTYPPQQSPPPQQQQQQHLQQQHMQQQGQPMQPQDPSQQQQQQQQQPSSQQQQSSQQQPQTGGQPDEGQQQQQQLPLQQQQQLPLQQQQPLQPHPQQPQQMLDPNVQNGGQLPMPQQPLEDGQMQQPPYDNSNLAFVQQHGGYGNVNTGGYMQPSSFGGWGPPNGQVDLKQSDMQQQYRTGLVRNVQDSQGMMQYDQYGQTNPMQQLHHQNFSNIQQGFPPQQPGGYQINNQQTWNTGQQLQQQQRQGYNPNNPNPPNSPVLVVGSLPSNWTHDMVFTLFGVYGVVLRVELATKQNLVRVQYATPFQANLAMTHLQSVVVDGKELQLSFDTQPEITPSMDQETREYSDSNLHRFKHHDSRNSRNIHPPSAVLHVSNLPQEVDEKFLGDLFKEGDTPNPQIQFFATDRRMAYVCMNTVNDGIMALVRCHNHQAWNRSLRVSFSHKNAQQVLKHSYQERT